MSKSLQKLKDLNQLSFSTRDAASVGVSSRALHYLLQRGLIERRSQGVYIFPGQEPDDLIDTIKERLLVYKKAIVGLNTALQLHDLTDEPYEQIDLIVPMGNVPTKRFDDVCVFQTRTPLSKINKVKLHSIPVTSIEQTIVDLLRFGEPLSKVLEAYYRSQQKRISVSIPKLKSLSETFRAKGKMNVFLGAIL